MSVTVTSLIHPTMIAKIRKAMYYAEKGQGHKMEGHGTRCYIQNAQGRNIMRLNWIGGRQGFIVYGQESKDITATVKAALHCVKVRDMATCYGATPDLSSRLGRIAALAGMGLALTGCQASGAMTAVVSVLGSLFT
jgi:hypothetical protein